MGILWLASPRSRAHRTHHSRGAPDHLGEPECRLHEFQCPLLADRSTGLQKMDMGPGVMACLLPSLLAVPSPLHRVSRPFRRAPHSLHLVYMGHRLGSIGLGHDRPSSPLQLERPLRLAASPPSRATSQQYRAQHMLGEPDGPVAQWPLAVTWTCMHPNTHHDGTTPIVAMATTCRLVANGQGAMASIVAVAMLVAARSCSVTMRASPVHQMHMVHNSAAARPWALRAFFAVVVIVVAVPAVVVDICWPPPPQPFLSLSMPRRPLPASDLWDPGS